MPTAKAEPVTARIRNEVNAVQRTYAGFLPRRVLANLTYIILRQTSMMQTGTLYSSLSRFRYSPPSEMMFMSLKAMMDSLKRKMAHTTAISHGRCGILVVLETRCSRLSMSPTRMVHQPKSSVVNAVEMACTASSELNSKPMRFAPAVPKR